jgi:hypothetical protein
MTDQVPEAAQRLAGELADAFEQDRGLAEQLTGAQHRVQAANDRLWSGLHPDVLGVVYDGAVRSGGRGESQVAESVVDAVRAGTAAAEVEAAVLSDLQEVHWAIHRAFSEHQQLSEDRRHLAAEIGELIAAFVAELIAAGWSEQDARQADVRQLAAQVA